MLVTVFARQPLTYDGRWIAPGAAFEVSVPQALVLGAQRKVSFSRRRQAPVAAPPAPARDVVESDDPAAAPKPTRRRRTSGGSYRRAEADVPCTTDMTADPAAIDDD